MKKSIDFHGLFREYPELTYALLAIVFYMASTIFGLIEMGNTVTFYGITFHTISTPLWVIFGILSLYFLYTAFFDMWIYTIHLIIAYFLAGAGTLAIFLFSDNIYFVIFGFLFLLGALVFTMLFIVRVGTVRRHHIMVSKNPEEAKEKYSLGYWYLFPFIFLGITIVAFLDLGYAYEHPSHFPYIYLLAEFLLFLVVIYILWVPENVLFFRYDEAVSTADDIGISHPTNLKPAGNSEKKSSSRDEIRQVITSFPLMRKGEKENCPGLDVRPVEKKKMCPYCRYVMVLEWCSQSEEYLIECPSCGRMTYYGRKVCVYCRTKLPENIKCKACGREFPIRKMKDVE